MFASSQSPSCGSIVSEHGDEKITTEGEIFSLVAFEREEMPFVESSGSNPSLACVLRHN
jgi:hypothetical protein